MSFPETEAISSDFGDQGSPSAKKMSAGFFFFFAESLVCRLHGSPLTPGPGTCEMLTRTDMGLSGNSSGAAAAGEVLQQGSHTKDLGLCRVYLY